MIVLVAKHSIYHRQALEVVTHVQFIRHAHAAVQLDGLLADITARISNLYFSRRNGLFALRLVFFIQF